jgi:hypothetical protein
VRHAGGGRGARPRRLRCSRPGPCGVDPGRIGKPWALQKKELRQIRAAAKKLPDGGMVSDPRFGPDAKLDKAQDTLTRYWFAHCG